MPFQRRRIIVDTNIILRILLKDHQELYEKALNTFLQAFEHNKHVFILQSVIAEAVYVLAKLYKIERPKISEALIKLLENPYVDTQDEETVIEALHIFSHKKIDFVDCLLCAYAQTEEVESMDRDVIRCMEERGGPRP